MNSVVSFGLEHCVAITHSLSIHNIPVDIITIIVEMLEIDSLTLITRCNLDSCKSKQVIIYRNKRSITSRDNIGSCLSMCFICKEYACGKHMNTLKIKNKGTRDGYYSPRYEEYDEYDEYDSFTFCDKCWEDRKKYSMDTFVNDIIERSK